jgi:DNA mismatch repair protein MutL
VHPAKTEVRFRQQGFIHDFVRDTVRATLMRARPVPQFAREIFAQPTAGQSLTPGAAAGAAAATLPDSFTLLPPPVPIITDRLAFDGALDVGGNAAIAVPRIDHAQAHTDAQFIAAQLPINGDRCAGAIDDTETDPADLSALATLKPLGQVRESFILAVNHDGLWIIDQHVAHERVLFERILRDRAKHAIEGQRLLMPLIIELTPGQQAIFTEISDELRNNGFEVEPFGARTIAVKTAPAGVNAGEIEKMLFELLEQFEREQQSDNLDRARHRIAASIACHAAIKVNMPLEQNKMEWLLTELAKTEFPMTCPHGRPVVLRYSLKDIQKAFKRI